MSQLLYKAIRSGNINKVKKYIASGANVNVKYDDGTTPLHIACGEANGLEIVKILIANGADLHAEDEDGDMPIHWASSGTHTELVELLIRAGADVNAMGDEDWTPLHLASRNADLDTVQLLLFHGANVHAQDTSGLPISRTPIDVTKDPQIIALLKGNGGKKSTAIRRLISYYRWRRRKRNGSFL